MKEELITFETAKLAKEKGFGKTLDTIFPYSYKDDKTVVLNSSNNCEEGFTAAPRQSELQKWLREEHEISIKIDDFYTDSRIRFDYNICKLGHQDDNPVGVFKTYEEALEEALFESLKTI
tara:strand:+ start:19052 stop:19411 length:360 start_codon:yes stop_codon:yes gene_type:complete